MENLFRNYLIITPSDIRSKFSCSFFSFIAFCKFYTSRSTTLYKTLKNVGNIVIFINIIILIIMAAKNVALLGRLMANVGSPRTGTR